MSISVQEPLLKGWLEEKMMELEKARTIASEVVEQLKPFCKMIEVAGSVRRCKPEVRDIDIVLIPWDLTGLQNAVMRQGPIKLSGKSLARFNYKGVQVDLYYATERTWATLLLIRTGSKESNIRLCTLARKKGWHLAASGGGLFNEEGERIAGDTEQSIYQTLGVPYQEPVRR